MKTLRVPQAAAAAALVLVILSAVPASAEPRLVLAGLRMDPTDRDARQFSRPGWGGTLELVAPLPLPEQLVAGVIGVDFVNLLSKKVEFRDGLTGLRIEQQTEQHYVRVSAGGQFGSHSRGTLRPYAGVNVAMLVYGISTDVVVPDDSDRENEIRQNLHDEEEVAFGWDANVGLDVNVGNHFSVDLGMRVLHAYGVPQQLGDGAVRIEPGYVQYKIGVGIPLRTFGIMGD